MSSDRPTASTSGTRTDRSASEDVAVGAWVRPLLADARAMRWHQVTANDNGSLVLACGGRVATYDIDASATQGLAPALRDRCPRCEAAADDALEHLFDHGGEG
jgi:hypothetical protein